MQPISVTKIGPYQGILPSVEGWAQVIGHNTIFVDERDPFAYFGPS
ncbi:MAG: proline racemase family protein [Pseudomonas sp.]